MKKNLMLLGSFALACSSSAQTKDSIPQKVQAIVADKFPAARVLNLSYEYNGGYKYSSNQKEGASNPGKISSFHQAGGSLNVNFLNRRNWALGTSLGYQYTALDVQESDFSMQQPKIHTEDFHYHYESLNFSYFSKLFGKMAIYSASIMTDGSEKGLERVRGMLTGTLVLKATRDVQMTIGLLGFVDPAAIIPLVPTFTYKQQYRDGWMVDVLLPKGAYVRKTMLRNGRLSLGSDLNTTIFYLYDFLGSDNVYTLSQMEINSGLTYEHNLGRSFIATVKSGMKAIPRSRIFEKNEKQNNYVWEATADPSFYVNVGLSFNPFAKKRR